MNDETHEPHLKNSGVSKLINDEGARPTARRFSRVWLDALDVVRFRLPKLAHEAFQLPGSNKQGGTNVPLVGTGWSLRTNPEHD